MPLNVGFAADEYKPSWPTSADLDPILQEYIEARFSYETSVPHKRSNPITKTSLIVCVFPPFWLPSGRTPNRERILCGTHYLKCSHRLSFRVNVSVLVLLLETISMYRGRALYDPDGYV